MDGIVATLALVALAGLIIVAVLRVVQGTWRVLLIIAVIVLALAVLITLNPYVGVRLFRPQL